jgi:hypothetical protein
LGDKRTFAVRFGSKANISRCNCHVRFTPESDIGCALSDVRFGPIADTVPTLFNHLVGAPD